MADPVAPSLGDPTGPGAGVNTHPPVSQPVNPGQTTFVPINQLPQLQQQQAQPQQQQQPIPSQVTSQSTPADVSAIIAQYEGRVRNLQSMYDRTIDERNLILQQITGLQAANAELQARYGTDMTAQSQNVTQLSGRITQLEAELAQARATAAKATKLMQNPELAGYAFLIPDTDNEEQLASAIAGLKAARVADQQRLYPQYGAPSPGGVAPPQQFPGFVPVTAGQQQQLPQGQSPTLPIAPQPPQPIPGYTPPLPGQYVPLAPGQPNPAFPQLTPATPSALNPNAGVPDPTAEITRIWDEAGRVGTDAAYRDAAERAGQLAATAAAQQQQQAFSRYR